MFVPYHLRYVLLLQERYAMIENLVVQPRNREREKIERHQSKYRYQYDKVSAGGRGSD